MRDYVFAAMGDRNEVTAESFPVQSKADVLAVLSSAAYSQENGFELTPGDVFIERKGFTIRDFTISRRGDTNGQT